MGLNKMLNDNLNIQAKKLIILLLTTLLIASCGQSEKLGKKIIGTWTIEKIYKNGKDVTNKRNPGNERWIEFKPNGAFESDGEPFGPNKGRWTTNDDKSILYLGSEEGDDKTKWKITFDHDSTTTWTGVGHPKKENTKLIHKRKSE